MRCAILTESRRSASPQRFRRAGKERHERIRFPATFTLPTTSWPTWSATPRLSATASWAWPRPTAADGIAKILPASRLRRGVVVTTTEAGVHVELYVVIEYGTNINTVSQNLIDQVTLRR